MGKSPVNKHSIGVVARRTGMKPDLIRAWERRYEAITPGRTDTNRRYYSDEQVDRLILLRKAILGGRQIGQISRLTNEELRLLVSEDQQAMAQAPKLALFRGEENEEAHLTACLTAIENLDSQRLRFLLEQLMTSVTQPRLIEQVLAPFLEQIGDHWEKGSLRIAHEHLASAAIQSFLVDLIGSSVAPDHAPVIVVATPSRQHHELGALLAAATAASEGWETVYLGANLPVEEIAAAVHQKAAEIVALSLVYPNDDPLLSREIERLRRLLGDEIKLMAGGRASRGYERVLKKVSGQIIESMPEFRKTLREVH